jgi:hypothetical protein
MDQSIFKLYRCTAEDQQNDEHNLGMVYSLRDLIEQGHESLKDKIFETSCAEL